MLRVIVGLLVLVIAGVFALLGLAKYRLEHTRFTEELAISVRTPGFSVDSAEQVAVTLEHALNGVKGLESLRSVTTANGVVVNVRATSVGVDALSPLESVREALTGVATQLPREAELPIIQRVDSTLRTVHFIARSDTLPLLDLSRWLDEVFRRELETQPGVREIQLCGAREPEFLITLDQPRLQAYGLNAHAVVEALQSPSLGATSPGQGFLVRGEARSIEALQELPLSNQVKLRDVATLELRGESSSCLMAKGAVLVSMRLFPEAQPKLATHPSVKLTPFTPVRTAKYLSAPGTSVERTMMALDKLHPDAVITAEGDQFTALFPTEPRLQSVPGLALRSMDDRHVVVQIFGEDFEQLTELAGKLHGALAKEQTRWLGTPWPGLSPEVELEPAPGVKGVAQALRLAIGGVTTGRLADGTPIRVRAGTSLTDALLPDGRPVSAVLQQRQTLAPAAMLRLNSRRTIELEAGLEKREVERAVKNVPLPAGVFLEVVEAPAR